MKETYYPDLVMNDSGSSLQTATFGRKRRYKIYESLKRDESAYEDLTNSEYDEENQYMSQIESKVKSYSSWFSEKLETVRKAITGKKKELEVSDDSLSILTDKLKEENLKLDIAFKELSQIAKLSESQAIPATRVMKQGITDYQETKEQSYLNGSLKIKFASDNKDEQMDNMKRNKLREELAEVRELYKQTSVKVDNDIEHGNKQLALLSNKITDAKKEAEDVDRAVQDLEQEIKSLEDRISKSEADKKRKAFIYGKKKTMKVK